MGPRTHLWICACKAVCLPPDLQVSMDPRPRLWICACKTASLAPEKQVYMVPPYICCFFQANQPD